MVRNMAEWCEISRKAAKCGELWRNTLGWAGWVTFGVTSHGADIYPAPAAAKGKGSDASVRMSSL
jgi:hypothetical protein